MNYQDELGNWGEIILEPSGDTLPVGAITQFGGETAPTNWLFCNGQAVSRETYAELFEAIGTTYGEGDGSTTFNVPDFSSRSPMGVGQGTDENGTTYETWLGQTYGEYTHQLTVQEMPSHNHKSGHFIDWYTQGGVQNITGGDRNEVNTSSAGGDQPHNTVQPVLGVNFIIKAKQSIGIVGTVSEDITDTNNNAVPNCETVKNYVDNKHTEIATAYLSSNIDNAGQQYLQMTQINSNSDKLTLSSGGILIGAGISKIKISGNIFGVSDNNNSYLWCYIRKNRGSTTTNESIAIDNTNTLFGSVSFSPKLIDVQEGDLIILYKEDGNSTSIRGAGNTWLTVEVVE